MTQQGHVTRQLLNHGAWTRWDRAINNYITFTYDNSCTNKLRKLKQYIEIRYEIYIPGEYHNILTYKENFARRKRVERALTVSQEHMTVTR